jgi:hypothetical protein
MGWLGLAAVLVAVAVAGSFAFTTSPLVFVYWDVGRLLPAMWFPFQLAAVAVNAVLAVAVVALASLLARAPVLRRQTSARATGVALIAAASIVVLLVYLYPHARTRLLEVRPVDGGPTLASVIQLPPA